MECQNLEEVLATRRKVRVHTILHVELDCRSIGRFAHPHVKILPLASFKEEHIVAVVQLSKLIQLIELRFGVKLRFFATVWEEGMQVVHQMSMSECRVSRVRMQGITIAGNMDAHRNVTPRELSMRTRWRFCFGVEDFSSSSDRSVRARDL